MYENLSSTTETCNMLKKNPRSYTTMVGARLIEL